MRRLRAREKADAEIAAARSLGSSRRVLLRQEMIEEMQTRVQGSTAVFLTTPVGWLFTAAVRPPFSRRLHCVLYPLHVSGTWFMAAVKNNLQRLHNKPQLQGIN